jgi:hypothetical protein
MVNVNDSKEGIHPFSVGNRGTLSTNSARKNAANYELHRLAPAEAIQFGRALPRILKGIFDADPNYGPVHLTKADMADGFYRVCINPADIPKLGVVFPTKPGAEAMVASSLVSRKQHSGTRLITMSVSRPLFMPSPMTLGGSINTLRAAQLASQGSYAKTLPLSVPLTLPELV